MATPSTSQSPKVAIFRNGNRINVTTSNSTALDGIDLQYDAVGSARLTSFSLTASTDTAPNSLLLSFVVPIPEGNFDSNSFVFMDSRFFDFKSTAIDWRFMDHIELFLSVSPTGNDYFRIFAGVVTNVQSTFKGYEFEITLTCKDMFFWLGRARVSTRWSVAETILRSGTDTADALKNVAYNTRYTGLDFKEIIEKLLYGAEETQFVGLGKIDTMSWFNIMGRGSILDSSIKNKTLESSDYFKSIQRIRGKLSGVNYTESPEHRSAIRTEDKRKTRLVHSAESAVFNGDIGKSEVLKAIASEQVNRKLIGQYWDSQFLSFIRDNYVNFGREYDWVILPYPFSASQQPLLFEGVYSTRLEMLTELASTSLYEIFQQPQGWIMVKPPMYNMSPINYIDPVEISSMSREASLDPVMTSVTVEGALVASAGDDLFSTNPVDIKAVQIDTSFPFIQGTYTSLFPKNFEPDIDKGAAVTKDSLQSFNWGKTIRTLFSVDGVTNSFEDFMLSLTRAQTANNKTTDLSVGAQEGGTTKILELSAIVLVGDNNGNLEEKRITLDVDSSNNNNYVKLTQLLIYKFLLSNLTATSLNTALRSDLEYATFFYDLEASVVNFFNSVGMSNIQYETMGLPMFAIKDLNNNSVSTFDSVAFSAKKYTKDVINLIKNIRDTYISLINPGAAQIDTGTSMVKDLRKTLYNDVERIFYGKSARNPNNAIAGLPNLNETLLDNEQRRKFELYKTLFQEPDRNDVFKIYAGAPVTSLDVFDEKGHYKVSTIPIDSTPSIQVLAKASFSLSDRDITIGEFNTLEHGFTSNKVTNRLVRTQEQAVEFAKYLMYIQNTQAERTTIHLETLRPDLLLGFPVLNKLDMNTYYPIEIKLSLNAGENFSTDITAVARRRPVWVDIESNVGKSAFSTPKKKADILINPKGSRGERSDIVKFESELSSTDHTNNRFKLLGWEYYGPDGSNSVAHSDIYGGEFLPPFGGVIDSIASDLTPTQAGSSGISNLKIVKIIEPSNPGGTYTFRVYTARFFYDKYTTTKPSTIEIDSYIIEKVPISSIKLHSGLSVQGYPKILVDIHSTGVGTYEDIPNIGYTNPSTYTAKNASGNVPNLSDFKMVTNSILFVKDIKFGNNITAKTSSSLGAEKQLYVVNMPINEVELHDSKDSLIPILTSALSGGKVSWESLSTERGSSMGVLPSAAFLAARTAVDTSFEGERMRNALRVQVRELIDSHEESVNLLRVQKIVGAGSPVGEK